RRRSRSAPCIARRCRSCCSNCWCSRCWCSSRGWAPGCRTSSCSRRSERRRERRLARRHPPQQPRPAFVDVGLQHVDFVATEVPVAPLQRQVFGDRPRPGGVVERVPAAVVDLVQREDAALDRVACRAKPAVVGQTPAVEDRKSTRLNSSHVKISYAAFCLKKKTKYPS